MKDAVAVACDPRVPEITALGIDDVMFGVGTELRPVPPNNVGRMRFGVVICDVVAVDGEYGVCVPCALDTALMYNGLARLKSHARCHVENGCSAQHNGCAM